VFAQLMAQIFHGLHPDPLIVLDAITQFRRHVFPTLFPIFAFAAHASFLLEKISADRTLGGRASRLAPADRPLRVLERLICPLRTE
jgi:hypothetical protein